MKFAPIVGIANQAATGTINGTPIPAENLWSVSAQGVLTGTAAGTLKLQASNDNPVSGTGQVPTNWSDISGATVTISAGGTGLISIQNLCYQWIRPVFTTSGGTGNVQAMVKVIGF